MPPLIGADRRGLVLTTPHCCAFAFQQLRTTAYGAPRRTSASHGIRCRSWRRMPRTRCGFQIVAAAPALPWLAAHRPDLSSDPSSRTPWHTAHNCTHVQPPPPLQQELVVDDNAEHAALLIDYAADAACRYKFGGVNYWFECRVLALEWHRAEAAFRWAWLDGCGWGLAGGDAGAGGACSHLIPCPSRPAPSPSPPRPSNQAVRGGARGGEPAGPRGKFHGLPGAPGAAPRPRRPASPPGRAGCHVRSSVALLLSGWGMRAGSEGR